MSDSAAIPYTAQQIVKLAGEDAVAFRGWVVTEMRIAAMTKEAALVRKQRAEREARTAESEVSAAEARQRELNVALMAMPPLCVVPS